MDEDDKLLRTLGALAAEQDDAGRGSKWERLTRGELPRDEIAELERLAAADAETASLLAAHRPIDELRRERIASQLASRLAAKRRAPRIAIVVSGLAAAAGMLLVVDQLRAPALPLYALEASGVSETRGAGHGPAPVCVVTASDTGSFEIVARTDEAVSGAVAARAFVVRNGETQPWTGALEISNGSVRVLESARLLEGASELRIVVGRPAAVTPEGAIDKAQGGAAAGRGWQVLRCEVRPGRDASAR